MYLDGIVAAESHASQLLVREMLHHFQEARIGAEKVLAEVGSALDKIFLILAVADFSQTPDLDSVAVGANQRIPVRSPDDLDYVPSCAAEDGFELLNDFSVAAHRAIEALQVAVHDENQVVEIFARGERNRSERLRLVPFPLPQQRPYFTAG